MLRNRCTASHKNGPPPVFGKNPHVAVTWGQQVPNYLQLAPSSHSNRHLCIPRCSPNGWGDRRRWNRWSDEVIGSRCCEGDAGGSSTPDGSSSCQAGMAGGAGARWVLSPLSPHPRLLGLDVAAVQMDQPSLYGGVASRWRRFPGLHVIQMN
jgi:hypothetical protein